MVSMGSVAFAVMMALHAGHAQQTSNAQQPAANQQQVSMRKVNK